MKRLYTLLALATVAPALHAMDDATVPLLEKTRLYPNAAIQADTRVTIPDTFVSLAQQEEQLRHDYVEENKHNCYSNTYLMRKFYKEKKEERQALMQKTIDLEQRSCTLHTLKEKKETIITTSKFNESSNSYATTLSAPNKQIDSIYTIVGYVGTEGGKCITRINLSHNNITALVLEKLISACPNATDIDVSNNKITYINHGNYTGGQLQKFNLSGNQLTHVDLDAFFDTFAELTNLDLSKNPITTCTAALPTWFTHINTWGTETYPTINFADTALNENDKLNLQKWHKARSAAFLKNTKGYNKCLAGITAINSAPITIASLLGTASTGINIGLCILFSSLTLATTAGASYFITKKIFEHCNKKRFENAARSHEGRLIFDESNTNTNTTVDL